jgi:hypothetical protein
MSKSKQVFKFPTGSRPDQVQTVFDEFHYHELMDRAYSVRHMFYELVECHALSNDPKIKDEMEKVGKVLNDFYQYTAFLEK